MSVSGGQFPIEIEKGSLKKCAQSLLDLVLERDGHPLIYSEFCEREPRLNKIPAEVFLREYVPAKLALGCVFWTGCCASHQIADKESKNLFFKQVMSLFESPKSLEDATRFSESLYASNAETEQSPVLGVLVHLFHKLGFEAVLKKGEDDEGRLSPAFVFMMEVCDALKNSIEGKFDDSIDAHEAIQTKKKEGAG